MRAERLGAIGCQKPWERTGPVVFLSSSLDISERWAFMKGWVALLILVVMSVDGHGEEAWSEFDGVSQVEIRGSAGDYGLYRNGKAYYPLGAGAVPGSLVSLKAYGANSLRTGHIDEAMLDEAALLGLTVSVCLDVGRERQGFDYSDAEAVAEQLARLEADVLRVKDHPALLTWIIGNELNLEASNPLVWDAVNAIAEMIHRVDPNHPVTTALAGLSARDVALLQTRAPALDFISTQVYGGIMGLGEAIIRLDIKKPIMVTEWGTVGHWEVTSTSWGAPIELSSADKARHYLQGYQRAIASHRGQVIGSYAFLWGQKQERTPTWYGTLMPDGAPTAAADVLAKIWTGRWPENQAPEVRLLKVNDRLPSTNLQLEPGSLAQAFVEAADPEGSALAYRWLLRPESQSKAIGGDAELLPEALPDSMITGDSEGVMIRVPSEIGPYRLFVEVSDSAGFVGHANFPFYVAEPLN